MSSAGTYSRIGYDFQDAVAAYYAVKMLENEDIISMYVEATGIHGSAIKIMVDDIILCYSSGQRKFIQVKSSSPDDKGWTINRLHEIKELQKIVEQLRECDSDIVELICPNGFGDLAQLKKDVNNFSDLISFKANAGDAPIKRLEAFSTKAEIDESLAFVYIGERITFGPKHLIDDWHQETRKRLSSDSAHEALRRLIIDHSLKYKVAPRILTKEYVKKIIDSYPASDSTSTLFGESTLTQWKNTEHRRNFSTRVVPIDSDYLSSSHDEWKTLEYPNLQLIIRPKNTATALEISKLVKRVTDQPIDIPLFWPLTEGVLGRNEWGVARYILRTPPKPNESFVRKFFHALKLAKSATPQPELVAFTQIYDANEVWFVDSKALDLSKPRVIPPDIERRFVETLNSARLLLQELGIDYPYEVHVVIRGVRNRTLTLLDQTGKPTSKNSHAMEKITIDKFLTVPDSASSSLEVLRPFFNELWDALLTQRPDHYDALALSNICHSTTE